MRPNGTSSAEVRNSAFALSIDDYLNGTPDIHCRIIDAAARLFHERGFSAVTMQDIGRAVGLSKAGLYHHCPSKDRLLGEIVRLAGELLLRQLETAKSSAESSGQRVRMFVITRMEIIARYQDFFAVIWQERPFINRADFADIVRMAQVYRGGVRRLIENGIKDGEIRSEVDPHLLMLAMDGMTGWAYLWYRTKGSESPSEIGEAFWTYLAQGILNDSHSARSTARARNRTKSGAPMRARTGE
jgi:TetR/AcrR family transcriptional regulator, cholesterol catabolism regulator